MREEKLTFAWRRVFFVALSALRPLSANAQGSGPAPGMEALVWLFMAGAALFVLVLSTVLFLVGKKVVFKNRKASLLEKFVLFVASILASCAAGVVVMIVFDIR